MTDPFSTPHFLYSKARREVIRRDAGKPVPKHHQDLLRWWDKMTPEQREEERLWEENRNRIVDEHTPDWLRTIQGRQ
jgi:hypothetical protein